MRKNKSGILKVWDTPHCSECKQPLALPDNLFMNMPAEYVSGYVWELTCEGCGEIVNVCPVIQWQTSRYD